jgi:hypothetical protein
MDLHKNQQTTTADTFSNASVSRFTSCRSLSRSDCRLSLSADVFASDEVHACSSPCGNNGQVNVFQLCCWNKQQRKLRTSKHVTRRSCDCTNRTSSSTEFASPEYSDASDPRSCAANAKSIQLLREASTQHGSPQQTNVQCSRTNQDVCLSCSDSSSVLRRSKSSCMATMAFFPLSTWPSSSCTRNSSSSRAAV